MSRRPSRMFPWIACALAAAATARAEVEMFGVEPGSGITIQIEGWAGVRTPATGRDTGLIPLEITITNASPAAHAWTIGPDERFSFSRGVLATTRLAVPAGGTGRTTLYIETDEDGGTIMLNVKGYGVAGGSDFVPVAPTPSLPPGGPDGDRQRRPVGQSQQVVAGRHDRPGDVVALDMSRAPTDWRGWSAFSGILMTADEWRGMPAAARKAALDRVALGGRLAVFAKAADESLPDLPRRGDGAFGAGSVAIVPWDGETIDERALGRACAGTVGGGDLLARYRQHSGPVHSFPMHAPVAGGWEPGFGKLADTFGPRTLPVGAILAFLAVFGIVAGPLNVMVLAGPGRRSRMFWTTPAISLAATAFLLALMFLRDGVGGSGARRLLAILDPERATMAVIQEQFSRTGVLLGSTFPIREPSWMHPLGAVEESLVESDGTVRSGGWFRSRSDQAYLVEAVRPSRARIEFVPGEDAGAPPAVVSSVDVPLDRVFVIDDEGRHWQAFDVGTGERQTMQAASAADYDAWFEGLLVDAGPVRKRALEAVRRRRGWTFAEADRPARVAIDTLGAIRWGDDRGVFVCPTTRGAAP